MQSQYREENASNRPPHTTMIPNQKSQALSAMSLKYGPSLYLIRFLVNLSNQKKFHKDSNHEWRPNSLAEKTLLDPCFEARCLLESKGLPSRKIASHIFVFLCFPLRFSDISKQICKESTSNSSSKRNLQTKEKPQNRYEKANQSQKELRLTLHISTLRRERVSADHHREVYTSFLNGAQANGGQNRSRKRRTSLSNRRSKRILQ
ncbi:hypothetical protein YC2023_059973 [Brassica napus]